jgi:hypothetical protein
MANGTVRGKDGSGSGSLSDAQQLINDSIGSLDSELRDINHKVESP